MSSDSKCTHLPEQRPGDLRCYGFFFSCFTVFNFVLIQLNYENKENTPLISMTFVRWPWCPGRGTAARTAGAGGAQSTPGRRASFPGTGPHRPACGSPPSGGPSPGPQSRPCVATGDKRHLTLFHSSPGAEDSSVVPVGRLVTTCFQLSPHDPGAALSSGAPDGDRHPQDPLSGEIHSDL